MLEGWPNTATRLAGWRRVTWQMRFCMWCMGPTACLFRTVPVALTGAAQLRAGGIFSCCYIVNVHNRPSLATSRMEAWPGTLVNPRLLSVLCWSQIHEHTILLRFLGIILRVPWLKVSAMFTLQTSFKPLLFLKGGGGRKSVSKGDCE
jgi:hypothetical protein